MQNISGNHAVTWRDKLAADFPAFVYLYALLKRKCDILGAKLVGGQSPIQSGKQIKDILANLAVMYGAFAAQDGHGVDVGGVRDEELPHSKHPFVETS